MAIHWLTGTCRARQMLPRRALRRNRCLDGAAAGTAVVVGDDDLRAAVPERTPVVFLCRSGVRSAAAARRATELGYDAYNVLEGFEGDPDENGHRGRNGGWRHRGLPWRQK
jgi:rhodanese-related sulfurtransferase